MFTFIMEYMDWVAIWAIAATVWIGLIVEGAVCYARALLVHFKLKKEGLANTWVEDLIAYEYMTPAYKTVCRWLMSLDG